MTARPRPPRLLTGPLADYLAHLQLKGCSAETLRTVRSNVEVAERVIGRPLLDATAEDMTGWAKARAAVLSPRARQSQQAALRNYFRWAMRSGLVTADPMLHLDPPKVGARLPRPISEVRLWQAVEDAPSDYLVAILVLAACAGLRACEVAGLRWEDVDLDAGTLRVVGKGSKERMVPLVDPVPAALRALGVKRAGPVLPRLDGQPGHVAPVRVSQVANLYLRARGVPDTFHALRHRFATRAYIDGGRDLRAVQVLLGHASPVVTAQYAAIDGDALRAAAGAAGR